MPKLALIIIDKVNDFFREGPLALRRADLVLRINELVRGFRQHNQPVIWVRQEFAADLSDAFLTLKYLAGDKAQIWSNSEILALLDQERAN